jgi:hypothetical protein
MQLKSVCSARCASSAFRNQGRVWELSYSDDGRATFRYGLEHRAGETHIIWLRVGTHAILSRPE